MAFCTKCGAQVQGPFCGSCGTPIATGAPAPGATASTPGPTLTSTPPSAAPASVPAAAGKTSPLVWVLAGCGGLIVIAALVFGVVLFKTRQFVHSASRNPAYAMARLAAAANPDIEVLSTDEDKGTMTVHNKKTGETLTVNMQDAQKGKFVFEQNGKKAEINAHADGDKGSFEIKSSEGSMKFGTNDKTPDWVPVYTGVTPQGVFSAQTPQGSTGSFRFTTNDSVEQVGHFYEDALKNAGMKLTTTSTSGFAMVSGEDAAAKRKVVVTASPSGATTSVGVTYTAKP
jgi:hypothetical protein